MGDADPEVRACPSGPTMSADDCVRALVNRRPNLRPTVSIALPLGTLPGEPPPPLVPLLVLELAALPALLVLLLLLLLLLLVVLVLVVAADPLALIALKLPLLLTLLPPLPLLLRLSRCCLLGDARTTGTGKGPCCDDGGLVLDRALATAPHPTCKCTTPTHTKSTIDTSFSPCTA